MPTVVIPCHIKVFQAVQPVLHSVIMYFILIQIISYRVGIAVHINVTVLSEIHRDKRGFQLRIPPGKTDTVPEISDEAPRILPQNRKLWEEILPFFVKFYYPAK